MKLLFSTDPALHLPSYASVDNQRTLLSNWFDSHVNCQERNWFILYPIIPNLETRYKNKEIETMNMAPFLSSESRGKTSCNTFVPRLTRRPNRPTFIRPEQER